MCILYSITTNQAAIIALFRVVICGQSGADAGGLSGLQGADRAQRIRGPRARHGAVGNAVSSKVLMDATKKRAEKLQAKGKTVDFKQLLRMEPDGGTTNIRNVKSKHGARWLGADNR